MLYKNKLTKLEVKEVLSFYNEEDNLEKENNAIIKKFNGKEIYTLIWNGKPCWIATDIAEVIGYKEKTKAVRQCIQSEEFEKGIDYDLLYGKDVRELINARCGRHLGSKKFINNLTIFYKEGLLGFINYAHMPIGKEFRKCLRTEVFSEIIEMELGKNIAESTFEIKRDNLSKNEENNSNEKLQVKEFKLLLKAVDNLLEEENSSKINSISELVQLFGKYN